MTDTTAQDSKQGDNKTEQTKISESSDINSILNRVTQLENEKKRLQQELESNGQRLEKMTEAKKQEMQKVMDTMIMKWLENLQKQNLSAEKAAEFQKGMESLVNKTADDSGIWQVVCSASAASAANVSQVEEYRLKCEELEKRLAGGEFSSYDSRAEVGEKRRAVDDPEMPARGPVDDIWSEFMCQYKAPF